MIILGLLSRNYMNTLRKQSINSIIWLLINTLQALYDRFLWVLISPMFFLKLKSDGINQIQCFKKQSWHHGARYFIGELNGKKVFIKNAKKKEVEKELLCLHKMKTGVCECYRFNLSYFTSYVVIEHIDGLTLTDYLSRDLSRNAILDIVRNLEVIAQELAYNNIVHRDLRPQNVFITFSGDVKIIDFALSVESGFFKEGYLTKILKLKGLCTQFKPSLYTWSDVYSLNKILEPYELKVNVDYFIFYKC